SICANHTGMAKKLSLKDEISRVLAYTPSERARGIIDSPYTKQILDQLPPQEAYIVIKESWGMDSQILLQYVSPESVCRFIDLDCWEQDSFSVDSLMEWLMELYNASFETLIEAFETIDLEILVLLFQNYIEVVHVRPTDEHIPDLIDEGFESLDNTYFYRIISDDDRSHFVKEMLSILFTHDQDLYSSILEAVMYELKTTSEETSYERRSLRLMELGFPSPDEALEVYRHIRPEKLLNQGILKEKTPVITKHLHMLPAVYLEQFSQGRSLLVTALDKTPEETRERFMYEMIYLANKIVMADFRPLNDREGIRLSMEKASSLATLGLGVVMREKRLPAEAVLNSMNAETLFSLGYNMVYVQQRRLKLLLNDIESSMIPEHMRELADGLLKKRPQYKALQFSSLEELDEVSLALDRLEAMAAIVSHLNWEARIPDLSSTNTGAGLDMEAIILTSLALNIGGWETGFRPISRGELLDFLSRATRLKGGLRHAHAAFRGELALHLTSMVGSLDPDTAEDIAAMLTTRLEEETGGLKDLKQMDPRFITCFCVRLPES
ncbi:MAG TPA: DUF6178 family protein, partial [Deltaproteobacteria bacterium]|nr:DUF6178 family protein [Deltaproteobacteria bacterium]